MSKTYHALLVGAPPQEEMRLEAPIDGQPSCSTLTLLESTPHVQWGQLSRVQLSPLTGRVGRAGAQTWDWTSQSSRPHSASHPSRAPMCDVAQTHQLRRHAAGIGCPIVGDDLYWDAAAAARAARGSAALPAVRAKGGLFLQSRALRFAHPATGEPVSVEVEEADKFEKLMERARRAVVYEELS